jgi:N-acetylglutamate synthase-like GNAT family acetyltransferase
MSEGISVREASEADVPRILEVLRAALGETPLLKRTPELFAWKHSQNPFGPSIVLVAEQGDRLAGVRAFMRWQLISPDGTALKCVRAVDTATHPDFHRRGVFRNLTMSAVEIAIDEGVDLIFNTPNMKSAPGYLSMGWKEIGWTGAMVRPRFGRGLAATDRPLALADATPGIPAFEVPQFHDRAPRGLRTPRTPDYLSWRFCKHPFARYGISTTRDPGAIIVRPNVRNGRTETVLADILGSAQASEIRRVVRASRCRFVTTWFSKGAPERRPAIAAGLLPVPGLRTLRLIGRPLSDLDDRLLEMGSWDLAVSDLELL